MRLDDRFYYEQSSKTLEKYWNNFKIVQIIKSFEL